MNKKLYRNTGAQLLAGVLSGLADYFEQDVVFVRLGFVIVLIITGLMPGILIYLAAWVIIPEKPTTEPFNETDYTVYQ